MKKQPVFFVPHGGGPCFFMEPMPGLPPDAWDEMERLLRGLTADLPEPPSAVLVISAHWEAQAFTLQSAERHRLLFDYYGFPPHTYQLQYPAAGAPDIAQRAHKLLQAAGLPAALEAERGLDHGVFVPMLLIEPQARWPVTELSLLRSLDPEQHLAAGRALESLREEGVLIIASGFSFHNLPYFFTPNSQGDALAAEFDAALQSAVLHPSATQRSQALKDWRSFPGAAFCHPRAEHLLPLMVAAGAGGEDAADCIYSGLISGKRNSAFRFG